MNCNFSINCGCCNCKNYTKTTAIKLANCVLQLVVPARELGNNESVCLRIVQNIPSGITPDTVVNIVVGSKIYAVITPCCANNLYADQIRKDKIYCLKFGSDTNEFIYRGGWGLCRTAHQFNCVPMTTVTSASVKSRKVETSEAET